MTTEIDRERVEGLGPAERIIRTLLNNQEHLFHGRPGVVTQDNRTSIGARWAPVTHKVEDGVKVVYRKDRVGKKENLVKLGVLNEETKNIENNGQVVGRYQRPGIFPEAAVWMYRQVADVYKMDNDFAARWASFAFKEKHRDLKLVLCAFMLVQSRHGEPVREGGEILFYDEDYREVGEAMLLKRLRGNDFNAKMILRIRDLLDLPGVVEINREMGFGNSTRRPFHGRYEKAVGRWLQYRENNLPMLEGLVNAGFRRTVMRLASTVKYKPDTEAFFRTLRWKQKQHDDGRRVIALDMELDTAETWEGLTEEQICEKIVSDKPSYKRIVSLVPKEIGLTRAIVAAAVTSGCMSEKDLVILSPTLEELGLLEVDAVKSHWARACRLAEDRRAANIAKRMKKTENAGKLEEAADKVSEKEIEKATRGMKIYVGVDVSGSMQNAIDRAKEYITQLLTGFPLDKVVVATFNSMAREVKIKHSSRAGVEAAFRGIRSGGGTNHGAAVRDVFAKYPPENDEDVLFLWVGDQGQWGTSTARINDSGLNPLAFGVLDVANGRNNHLTETAAQLGIPCFSISPTMFESDDPYVVTRTLRHLVESTPVGQANRPRSVQRESLVEQILKTEPLKVPAWARV